MPSNIGSHGVFTVTTSNNTGQTGRTSKCSAPRYVQYTGMVQAEGYCAARATGLDSVLLC